MSLHDVLGVLGNDEALRWVTFDRAVRLADTEYARLTLAKTTDPGWVMRWFAPAAIQSMAIPYPDFELETIAGDVLASVTEFVPGWIPVTTVLLGRPTGRALLEMIRSGAHDAFVCSEALLAHNAKLARELGRLCIRTVTVSRRPAPAIASPLVHDETPA